MADLLRENEVKCGVRCAEWRSLGQLGLDRMDGGMDIAISQLANKQLGFRVSCIYPAICDPNGL